MEPCILSCVMGCINRHKIGAKRTKVALLEFILDAQDKGIWGQPRFRWRGVLPVLQKTLGTPLLEPEDPEAERDRVVIVKTDLNVLHNPTVAANVAHCDVVIAIRSLAGLAYTF